LLDLNEQTLLNLATFSPNLVKEKQGNNKGFPYKDAVNNWNYERKYI